MAAGLSSMRRELASNLSGEPSHPELGGSLVVTNRWLREP
jgi:hypothetical protein